MPIEAGTLGTQLARGFFDESDCWVALKSGTVPPMRTKELRDEFSKRFRPFFEIHGFRARAWDTFERRLGDLSHLVHIGPLPKRRGGYALTGGGFGVRLGAVERIRGGSRDSTTVGMPLHMIPRAENLPHEWIVENPDELALAAREIMPAIEEHGFPYLDRFRSAIDIRAHLEAQDWGKWFACSRDGRDSLLVYIAAVESGPQAAIELGERLFEYYKHLPYSRSRLLSEAIDRCRRLNLD